MDTVARRHRPRRRRRSWAARAQEEFPHAVDRPRHGHRCRCLGVRPNGVHAVHLGRAWEQLLMVLPDCAPGLGRSPCLVLGD